MDVEGEAANMLFEAQMEADEKVANVKKMLDIRYKEFADNVVEEFESLLEKQKREVDLVAKKEVEDYKEKIYGHPLNYEAFANKLDAYFSI